MTRIIGILTETGIAIGADRFATLGALGESTVQQETQKIEIIKDRMIVGVSGYVGLGQRIIGSLEEVWNADLSKQIVQNARTQIRESLWKYVQPELVSASLASKVIGPVAASSAVCQTLIAAPIQKKPVLLQYDQQCASEVASRDLPFISIGSGRTIADPFLAFLKRVLWNESFPNTVGEAVFATLWTLQHVIRTHARGGIGGDPQIAVLKPKGQGYIAEFLTNDDLEEHRLNIKGAEAAIGSHLQHSIQ